jgi:hypothetical protein
MSATAANLMERVLPETALRQWVLTFPFRWRRRLAQDGALLGTFTRIFVETVHRFYADRAAEAEGAVNAKTGSVTVIQRTSSDLRLNPHLHTIVLDGAWHEGEDGELGWRGLGHLQTSEVGKVLQSAVKRMMRHLRRRGLLLPDEDDALADLTDDPESALTASAVSGRMPPAGPQWVIGLPPLAPRALAYDKHLCASVDGFTLHAATRAGALDPQGREALLCYVLRPPLAPKRLEVRPDGLVRITLKKPYSDGTIAVDMDPLSLLSRLAASVPPPRFHTVHYAGVLGAGSPWRPCISPESSESPQPTPRTQRRPRKDRQYRPWAELLARTFAVDVLTCPRCHGPMRLLAVIKDSKSIARYLAAIGEATELPRRTKSRGPPYWKSQVLRRQALGVGADDDHGPGQDHVA